MVWVVLEMCSISARPSLREPPVAVRIFFRFVRFPLPVGCIAHWILKVFLFFLRLRLAGFAHFPLSSGGKEDVGVLPLPSVYISFAVKCSSRFLYLIRIGAVGSTMG